MALRSRRKSKKKDNKVSEDKSATAENAEETRAEATPGVEGPRWPLFYSQPVPLSIERHGDKSISLEKRFGFCIQHKHGAGEYAGIHAHRDVLSDRFFTETRASEFYCHSGPAAGAKSFCE